MSVQDKIQEVQRGKLSVDHAIQDIIKELKEACLCAVARKVIEAVCTGQINSRKAAAMLEEASRMRTVRRVHTPIGDAALQRRDIE